MVDTDFDYPELAHETLSKNHTENLRSRVEKFLTLVHPFSRDYSPDNLFPFSSTVSCGLLTTKTYSSKYHFIKCSTIVWKEMAMYYSKGK